MEVSKNNPIGLLSNFWIKMIAIVTMTIDHIGFAFFPRLEIFRIIGRLAFPLFAFLIAEGCSYTKNKIKRFLLMLIVGIVYLLVYYIYSKQIYGSIFVTFTFSIFFIFLLQDIKKTFAHTRFVGYGNPLMIIKKYFGTKEKYYSVLKELEKRIYE